MQFSSRWCVDGIFRNCSWLLIIKVTFVFPGPVIMLTVTQFLILLAFFSDVMQEEELKANQIP
jgi:hypothetical protein